MDVRDSDPTHLLGLRADINRTIGEQLRLMHRQIVDEEVPQHFISVLKRLDESKDGDPQE
jgi:anti-sigma factor NepR-like protein